MVIINDLKKNSETSGKNDVNLVIVVKIFKVGDIYICNCLKKVVYYICEHSFLVALERIEHNGI